MTGSSKIDSSNADSANLRRAMKRSRTAKLVLMGVAPLALSACAEQQEALIYPTVEACVAGGLVSEAECRSAYDTAKVASDESAPRYLSRADCIADFGADQCQSAPHSQGYFLPLMTGFMIARALDGGRYYPQPLYRPRTGEWTTGGGYTIGRDSGRVVVDKDATKPQRAITQSRAGFGSRAAARGSWGG